MSSEPHLDSFSLARSLPDRSRAGQLKTAQSHSRDVALFADGDEA